jgi:hypothetical protein
MFPFMAKPAGQTSVARHKQIAAANPMRNLDTAWYFMEGYVVINSLLSSVLSAVEKFNTRSTGFLCAFNPIRAKALLIQTKTQAN